MKPMIKTESVTSLNGLHTQQSDSYANQLIQIRITYRGAKMAATQRNSFSPTDRTNSQFMPLKVFGSERKRGNQEIDQLDIRLIGNSKPMQALKRSIRLVANSSETVLITRESGTGKELIAHAIHDLSARCREPFLAINCGALTESLVESELFGHVSTWMDLTSLLVL
jgi:transcriptional regulator with GAF, ATPase, and Fis domain